MATTVTVQVKQDHLERLAQKRTPLYGIAELIWNSLDGDASNVAVHVDENGLFGLESIRVIDNGLGIPYETALRAFKSLGASWKKGKSSPSGRVLHGQAGEGRYSAFGFGSHVEWRTTYREGKTTKHYEIVGDYKKLGSFEISDPKSVRKATGTEVTITGFTSNPRGLTSDNTADRLAEIFAPYLSKYPDIRITYGGKLVDPTRLQEHVEEVEVKGIVDGDGKSVPATLTVIEWKMKVDKNASLVLCDENGFALSTRGAGIAARGFEYTAYLRCSVVRGLYEQNYLEYEELHPQLRSVLDAAKSSLRDHFRKRTAELSHDVVQQWKAEDVYPFRGEALNPIEIVERQVFDVLALNVSEHLPDFVSSDSRSKRFSLEMLKTAIKQSPGELRRIIEGVLGLSQERREELAELLERTSLSAIIGASKVVVSRLEFVAGLEVLVFDPDIKKITKERAHLHRILADNTWVFGEEFNLSVDDESLNQVLKRHLEALGREVEEVDPVKRSDGTAGIVDLMLSRRIPLPKKDDLEHLVIELKRPSKRIDAEVLTQIESYAFAVADDERFKDSKVRWVFWVVSNDMDDHARRKVTAQKERPAGLVHHDDRVTVWAKTWSQVIDECKGRLAFFQERLEYMATHEHGLEHLKRLHSKYLPEDLKDPPDEET